MIEDRLCGALYMFNHLEYDAETLNEEFQRDRRAGKPTNLPKYYFENDDPGNMPTNRWRPYAQLFMLNWIVDIHRESYANIGRVA